MTLLMNKLRDSSLLTQAHRAMVVAGMSVVVFSATTGAAQVSPEEHRQHHPEQAGGGAPGAGEDGGSGGGMGGMMDSMMERMGAPAPKEMYPRLMDLPELSTEQLADFEREAHQRMIQGTRLLAEGLDALSTAAANDDFALMQSATANMREGLSQFESGVAARRAIAEGQAPRNVALQWFRREMNLAQPMPSDEPRALLGASPLHLFSMVLLVLFAMAMVALYFAKMRRAQRSSGASRPARAHRLPDQHRRLPEPRHYRLPPLPTSLRQTRREPQHEQTDDPKGLAARKRPQSLGSR